MQNVAQHYQTQQIMTASPAKLVAMLFDRAILALRDAARAIEEGDIEKRHKSNSKAFEIINHLDRTLDLERGGEVAANLNRLYSYILRQLPQIDFKNDKTVAEEMIKLLEPLRDSWNELADQGAVAPSPRPQPAMNDTAKGYANSSATKAPQGSQDQAAAPSSPSVNSLNFSA